MASTAKTRIVAPGDYLCAPEEFMAGPSTYVEGGAVRAAAAGMVIYDFKSRRVVVKPFAEKKAKPGAGDLVLGVVTAVREDVATITVLMDDKWRPFSSPFTSLLHVSQASRQYTKSLSDAVKLGDLVRVKVLRDSVPMHVSMRDAGLGVLAAYCSKCGALLVQGQGSSTLRCPRCGNTETRKTAPDYVLRAPSRRKKRSGERK